MGEGRGNGKELVGLGLSPPKVKFLLTSLFKFPFRVNRLSHTVHTYDLGLSSCGCSAVSLLSASNFTSNVIPTYTTNVYTFLPNIKLNSDDLCVLALSQTPFHTAASQIWV